MCMANASQSLSEYYLTKPKMIRHFETMIHHSTCTEITSCLLYMFGTRSKVHKLS